MSQKQKIIVGISGASGVCYGIKALELLSLLGVESHLVISKAAALTLRYESDVSMDELQDMADVNYANKNIGADIASGSFKTLGMLIAPCSVRSMSEISSGVTSSLLSRAADVVLKERRKLVLMVRETPLHTGHLRTMVNLSEMGAIIAPPVPAFYTKPKSLDDIVRQSVGRALDLFAIEGMDGHDIVKRWEQGA